MCQSSGGPRWVPPVEIITAAFVIFNPGLSQDVPSDGEYAVCNGDSGLFQAAPLGNPEE
jgi:hypothetical protein